MIRHLFLIALLTGTMAVPAISARPSGPGITNPQIAFVKSSTGGRRQLMVANEDGSGATAIYTSTRMLSPHMGSDGKVYFWDGGRFNSIAVTGGAPQLLFSSNATVPPHSDLSPDGSTVAWFSAESGGIFRYSIASGQQAAVTVVPFILALGFDRTGQNIIFTTQVSDVDYEFRIVPTSGGSSNPLGLTGRYSSFDASHLDSTLVISVHPAGASPYLGVWEPGMAAPIRIADGYRGTWRCDDSAIIYQRVVSSGSALFRRTTGGAITTVAKPESIWASYKQVC